MAEEKTTPSKLEDLIINQSDFPGIVTLKDRPNEPKEYGGSGLSAEDLKKAFDKIPIAALEGLNKLINFLKDTDYSEEIKIGRGDYTTLASLVSQIGSGGFASILNIELGDSEYLEGGDAFRYKNLTARIKYFLSQISDIQTKTIPNAIDDLKGGVLPEGYETLVKIAGKVTEAKNDAVEAAKDHTDTTVSNLKGGTLPEGYETLVKIANGVTELFKRIDDLIGEGNLSKAFDTLVEVDAYLTEHESLYKGIENDISDLKDAVEAAKKDAKEKANAAENNAKTYAEGVAASAKSEAIVDAKSYTDKEVSELDEKVNNNYNSLGMAIDDAEARAKKYTDDQIAKVSGGDTIYVEDSEEKHIKIIPSGAYPYAFVNKIGGKTEKVTREGENIAELSASDNVTLSNGEFSLNIPSNQSSELFTGVGLSANLNPYIRYAINKRDTTMPSGCSVSFEYYLSGEDADGNLISSNIGSPNSVLPCELGFAKNVNLSIDLSYYTNTTSASKTVKFKLSVESMLEYMLSAPVTSVISQGRNLVDFDGVAERLGWKLQENGYWQANASTEIIFVNTLDITGVVTISFNARIVKANNLDTYPTLTPLMIQVFYEDGSTMGIRVPNNETTFKQYIGSTNGKTVDRVSFLYGTTGTFEIKDLMINLGDTALPYEPYAVSKRAIPNEITSINGYGDSGNTMDFDELEYSRTRGRKVVTGAAAEEWKKGAGTTAPYMYIINISDKYEGPCAESNYFRFAGEAEEINNPEPGTYTEWYGDKDIGYYSDIGSVEEWKAYLATLNAAGAPLTVVYDLGNPEEISLSEASDINPITIANGDMVIFENAENLDMPNTIEYVKRVKEADV